MRKHKWKLLRAASTIALVAVGAFVLWPRPSRVTLENSRQIAPGMSRREVRAALGPPGDYSAGPVDFVVKGTRDVWDKDLWTDDRLKESDSWKGRHDSWTSDTAYCSIYFGQDDTVVGVRLAALERDPQGPLDNFLWRVRRQWRQWFP